MTGMLQTQNPQPNSIVTEGCGLRVRTPLT
jgi:hypothetical protein